MIVIKFRALQYFGKSFRVLVLLCNRSFLLTMDVRNETNVADSDIDKSFSQLLTDLTATQHTLPSSIKQSLCEYITNTLKGIDDPLDPIMKKYLVFGWFFSELLDSANKKDEAPAQTPEVQVPQNIKRLGSSHHGYHD